MLQEKRMHFELDMEPPGTTHQTKKVRIAGNGRRAIPVFYEPDALKMARQEYMVRLARYAPAEPIKGPVSLHVVFVYRCPQKKISMHPKITRPDTDNMIKLLKDCMTATGFWLDDAQVYNERVIKMYGVYAKKPDEAKAGRPMIVIDIGYYAEEEPENGH